ncbi:MAG: hypothetical protein DRQ88_11580 [Epsilonproteobacteria bacterium]|nr:MAG: hypothetical protein DRQ88_11580 [Campylobacterota bacterium]
MMRKVFMRKFLALRRLVSEGDYEGLWFRGKWFTRELLFSEPRYQYYKRRKHDGFFVLDEEWKYLVILDACRFDYFKRYNTIKGKLSMKLSRGSSTPEWLTRNFIEYYDDIVYVSANPYISHTSHMGYGFVAIDHFHTISKVWDFGWDEKTKSTPPREVTDNALKLAKKYPNKRMIIHYIQPHFPYIGNIKMPLVDMLPKFRIHPQIREAYRDNLLLVLNEAERLVKKLDGETIISSDHGECLGEHHILGHPSTVYVPELINVPWLKVGVIE